MGIKVASGLYSSFENAVELSVNETISALQVRKNCFEVLGEINRVFLDIDGKRLPEEMTFDEWKTKRDETERILVKYADEERRAIMCSSKYEARIISFRMIFPNIKTSKDSNKAFAIALQKELQLPAGVSIDAVPYGKNQKMRMLGSSKDGEDRPMVLLHGTAEDTLISHVGDAIEREFRVGTEEKKSGPVQIVEQKRLVSICRLINDERWFEYKSCLSLIFALVSCGATHEFIHEQCMRGKNYSQKWVSNAIRDWKITGSPTFGTLIHYAKLDNPVAVETLERDEVEVAVEEIMSLDTTNCPAEDLNWCEQGRWLKDLPNDPTIAVSSMLGTGKTNQQIKASHISGTKRILFISVRNTFSDHILSQICGFKDYRITKERDDSGQIVADRALVSIQSLWRRGGDNEDLVILDESETIFANISPNTTHGKNYVANITAFERIVRGATRVIALDAFLSNRTINCLRVLRPSVRIIVNPAIPYDREAMVFDNYGAYVNETEKRIVNGKKTYMFWGSKEKGIAFHALLKCPNQMYNADTDKPLVKQHLSDVNTHWAKLRVVGGTTSISVGVNYTGTPAFDQVFAYVTPYAGGSGRDTMQSIHRVRSLNDNKMVLFIERKPNNMICGEIGLAAQKREYNSGTQRQINFLEKIGEPPTDYSRLPVWVRDVIAWNRNERLVNARHLRAVCFAYMKRCGIRIVLNSRSDVRELEKGQYPHHSEIDDIDAEQADFYQLNRSALTSTQKFELEKFYMLQKVTNCFLWNEWLKNSKQIINAWRIRNETPIEIVQNGPRCVDLVSRDAEKLNVLLSLGINFKTEFRKPIAELPDINIECWGVRKQSEKITKEQIYRELCSGLESWARLYCNVERKQAKKKGERITSYFLVYRPEMNPLQQSVRTNLTCAEVWDGYEE